MFFHFQMEKIMHKFSDIFGIKNYQLEHQKLHPDQWFWCFFLFFVGSWQVDFFEEILHDILNFFIGFLSRVECTFLVTWTEIFQINTISQFWNTEIQSSANLIFKKPRQFKVTLYKFIEQKIFINKFWIIEISHN